NYEKALQIFKKIKDISALGYSYCGLGGSSRIDGKFSESLKFYQQANEIFKKIEDKFGTAYSYCGIGNAFRMMNNLKEAEKNFNKAISIYKEIGDIVSSSYTLWSLAITKLISEYKSKKKIKDYQEAFNFILLAEKNFKKCNDPRGLIYCKIIKAMIHYLKHNKSRYKKILIDAINNAKNYDFILEKKYAQGILNGKYPVPYNIP
ncbi:MAG: tetratricopeptide repeat protein, partial [Thermodesulfovibrio sp.]|nr:tetratricopeptide repeat protein [Thermodesulfovibrio sp.]